MRDFAARLGVVAKVRSERKDALAGVATRMMLDVSWKRDADVRGVKMAMRELLVVARRR